MQSCRLHGNIFPDSLTLWRCGVAVAKKLIHEMYLNFWSIIASSKLPESLFPPPTAFQPWEIRTKPEHLIFLPVLPCQEEQGEAPSAAQQSSPTCPHFAIHRPHAPQVWKQKLWTKKCIGLGNKAAWRSGTLCHLITVVSWLGHVVATAAGSIVTHHKVRSSWQLC